MVNYLIIDKYKIILEMIFIIVSAIAVYKLLPAKHKNNPLSSNERKRYEKVSRIITLIIVVLINISFYIDYISIEIIVIASLTILMIAVLTITLVSKGGKNYN